MSFSVTVLVEKGQIRQHVPAKLSTPILVILEEVCKKHELKSEEYDLKCHNRILDVASTVQFCNIPNNVQLELVPASKSRTESPVTIFLQLETGERLSGSFPPSSTLWEIISTLCDETMKSEPNPVIIYTRQEVLGDNLKSTSLRMLGLMGGNALLRLLHRSEVQLRNQSSASTYKIPVKRKAEESERRRPRSGSLKDFESKTPKLEDNKEEVGDENIAPVSLCSVPEPVETNTAEDKAGTCNVDIPQEEDAALMQGSKPIADPALPSFQPRVITYKECIGIAPSPTTTLIEQQLDPITVPQSSHHPTASQLSSSNLPAQPTPPLAKAQQPMEVDISPKPIKISTMENYEKTRKERAAATALSLTDARAMPQLYPKEYGSLPPVPKFVPWDGKSPFALENAVPAISCDMRRTSTPEDRCKTVQPFDAQSAFFFLSVAQRVLSRTDPLTIEEDIRVAYIPELAHSYASEYWLSTVARFKMPPNLGANLWFEETYQWDSSYKTVADTRSWITFKIKGYTITLPVWIGDHLSSREGIHLGWESAQDLFQFINYQEMKAFIHHPMFPEGFPMSITYKLKHRAAVVQKVAPHFRDKELEEFERRRDEMLQKKIIKQQKKAENRRINEQNRLRAEEKRKMKCQSRPSANKKATPYNLQKVSAMGTSSSLSPHDKHRSPLIQSHRQARSRIPPLLSSSSMVERNSAISARNGISFSPHLKIQQERRSGIPASHSSSSNYHPLAMSTLLYPSCQELGNSRRVTGCSTAVMESRAMASHMRAQFQSYQPAQKYNSPPTTSYHNTERRATVTGTSFHPRHTPSQEGRTSRMEDHSSPPVYPSTVPNLHHMSSRFRGTSMTTRSSNVSANRLEETHWDVKKKRCQNRLRGCSPPQSPWERPAVREQGVEEPIDCYVKHGAKWCEIQRLGQKLKIPEDKHPTLPRAPPWCKRYLLRPEQRDSLIKRRMARGHMHNCQCIECYVLPWDYTDIAYDYHNQRS